MKKPITDVEMYNQLLKTQIEVSTAIMQSQQCIATLESLLEDIDNNLSEYAETNDQDA